MKYNIGIFLKKASKVLLVIGALVFIISVARGLAIIFLGCGCWLAGNKLEEIADVERARKVEIGDDVKTFSAIKAPPASKPVTYQQIDYSHIPYDIDAGWKLADNRFQALTDISYMNEFLKEARSLANIKQRLEICTEEVLWEGESVSSLEKTPHTKTGKVPKYIVDFFFTTRDCMECDPPDYYLGHIYYMQDGSVGKAWVMCWIKKTGYRIDIGLVGTSLIIKKIEKYTPQSEGKEVIYKWQ